MGNKGTKVKKQTMGNKVTKVKKEEQLQFPPDLDHIGIILKYHDGGWKAHCSGWNVGVRKDQKIKIMTAAHCFETPTESLPNEHPFPEAFNPPDPMVYCPGWEGQKKPGSKKNEYEIPTKVNVAQCAKITNYSILKGWRRKLGGTDNIKQLLQEMDDFHATFTTENWDEFRKDCDAKTDVIPTKPSDAAPYKGKDKMTCLENTFWRQYLTTFTEFDVAIAEVEVFQYTNTFVIDAKATLDNLNAQQRANIVKQDLAALKSQLLTGFELNAPYNANYECKGNEYNYKWELVGYPIDAKGKREIYQIKGKMQDKPKEEVVQFGVYAPTGVSGGIAIENRSDGPCKKNNKSNKSNKQNKPKKGTAVGLVSIGKGPPNAFTRIVEFSQQKNLPIIKSQLDGNKMEQKDDDYVWINREELPNDKQTWIGKITYNKNVVKKTENVLFVDYHDNIYRYEYIGHDQELFALAYVSIICAFLCCLFMAIWCLCGVCIGFNALWIKNKWSKFVQKNHNDDDMDNVDDVIQIKVK